MHNMKAVTQALIAAGERVSWVVRLPNDKGCNYRLADGLVVSVYDTGSVVVNAHRDTPAGRRSAIESAVRCAHGCGGQASLL